MPFSSINSVQYSSGSHAAVLGQGMTTHMSKELDKVPMVMVSVWHVPAWVQSL
jgi:hypothetical protein